MAAEQPSPLGSARGMPVQTAPPFLSSQLKEFPVDDFAAFLAAAPLPQLVEAIEEQETYGYRGTYDQLTAELDRRGVER